MVEYRIIISPKAQEDILSCIGFVKNVSLDAANQLFDDIYGFIEPIKDKFFKPADVGLISFVEVLNNISKELGMDYNDIYEEFKGYGKINDELFKYILKLKSNILPLHLNDSIILLVIILRFISSKKSGFSFTK